MTAEEKYPLLIGHAIDGNKRLHNIQQVAGFICKHGQYGDVSITFEDSTPFLDTFGIYINKIADMDYREELLKTLIPMQIQLENDTDEQENEPKEPIKVKNLADLKRLIKPGTELMATYHGKHPEIVGLVRVVTEVQSNAFYSVIKDQPDHKYSTCNYGKGFRTDFEKAGFYRFNGSTIQVLDARRNDGSVLCEIEVYGSESSMTEQNKEESKMNEWDRLHRQAERYKQSYPPRTRIMLLSMGNDPQPVEDNTRGTVMTVDDIGTLHCSFDNGRSLGVVPGEDSFRKLTDEELAEEQTADMDEDESGPVMGM